uniref:Bifunctional protein HldE n=1 Tax=Magnetococcus marinus (strain ATCC BAA-1437 / JCM 17883 / MC-1) TaxID=156889 RepID=HLDE_MAGMM|nr:RecName: Full=Bifunctional protein HldE; Includes: RecName: Full=D-beta-D-heptose 7-phosphate kinase; AltName: Full=D-beta-D-heptose 7-phosphotransferase; AltName: Full=D-glycero-beta-D-manno-heptose-7-phosphate kinase; Includes: RecName: Full=D-beta-D-heptose 1-phosphate adenylyltransferase; AltName: Full=D-glycero-beta-D-manno-heptose 1-phosphate adenylyltransferase [Magnetococcus marinus MC-1]
MLHAVETAFYQKHVLVVGDLMLDRYLWGDVTRISPEAPVPVVHMQRESHRCGGAANVASNLAKLGLHTSIVGFVGEDSDGQVLISALQESGIDTHGILPLAGWSTITKTRVIGGHQQILRMDRETPLADTAHASQLLHQQVMPMLEGEQRPHVIILSDYAKGVLSFELCQALIVRARNLGIPVLVDPKGRDYARYRHATALSPNRGELRGVTGVEDGDLNTLLDAGESLRQSLDVAFLAVTLSEQGIALVDGSEHPRRIPAMAQEVYDVSGAGDTVIATLGAGLAAGLTRLDALHLANLAAGVVVGKLGTAAIDLNELRGALLTDATYEQSDKIANWAHAKQQIARWHAQGEKVVFTNGCFDLLHAGHVTYLEHARRLGQRLVLGLNTDASVSRLKGPERPLIQEQDRARVLAALAAVDLVVLFEQDTPLELIEQLRPDILAKGADYREDQVVGGDLVRRWGGRVALVQLVQGRSTTGIVQRISAQK